MFITNARRSNLAHNRRNGTFIKAVSALARTSAAIVMRALVLLLAVLLLLFAGLMCLTGRYELGVLVVGGVLFVGLGAANYAR
jgi:hypothetical protein